MDGFIGIAGALAVILLGLALFIAIASRRKRAIEAAGYVEVGTADKATIQLTKTLFELSPVEIHRKDEPSGQSTLVFVDSGGSEDSGCAMIAYRLGHDWPLTVMVRSGRRIPDIFRKLTDGILKQVEPMDDTEAKELIGTGWFAYRAPNKTVPATVRERLFRAARLPRSEGLLGIAVIAPYLAVWSDAGRIKTLLALAPEVRELLQPGAD